MNIPFLGLAILFYLSSLYLLCKKKGETKISQSALQTTSRLFFLSLACCLLTNIDSWLMSTFRQFVWIPCREFVLSLSFSFSGAGFQSIFRYFIDAYFIGCLLLMFPYFHRLENPTPLQDDKYVSFFKTLVSLPGVLLRRPVYWNRTARLGMLTVLLKLFFVPLMVSWSINNWIHIRNLFTAFQWDYYFVNRFLVDLFILVDTTIFAFGYLVESGRLKSEIRSVDPTFLGWLVCLWCYPPFNSFSFRPFEYYLIKTGLDLPVWGHMALTAVITLLWGIFAWASVALGPKASNLTSRGVVANGPYRYARHPAYAAKLLIWFIQGIFFSQFGIIILAGFAAIYWLRSWTEERHLLATDPDYFTYRKEVRWWFIPGIL